MSSDCSNVYQVTTLYFSPLFSDEEEQVLRQESQVTQEMLEEQMVRLLTREVMDLLSKLKKKIQSHNIPFFPQRQFVFYYLFCLLA